MTAIAVNPLARDAMFAWLVSSLDASSGVAANASR
jgi:hypothetical protein